MSKQTILMVDDSDMNRAIMLDLLKDNYNILEATGGVQALEILDNSDEQISLVLLDTCMPDLDGFQVLEELNENGMIDDVPVVIVSADERDSSKAKAEELGAVAYIVRPFDKHLFVKDVTYYVDMFSMR